ncbi:hypothetical protein MTO96_017303 [Rhipicephalus appendiculatus]
MFVCLFPRAVDATGSASRASARGVFGASASHLSRLAHIDSKSACRLEPVPQPRVPDPSGADDGRLCRHLSAATGGPRAARAVSRINHPIPASAC